MTFTVNEIIQLYEENSNRTKIGLETAVNTSNYFLAALNCSEGFNVRLMKGLVQWRKGDEPVGSFVQAVAFHIEAFEAIRGIAGSSARLGDTYAHCVGFVAHLVEANWYPLSLEGLAGGQLLDGVLANSLFADFDEPLWNRGMAEFKLEASQLAIDTYQAYAQLVTGISSSRHQSVDVLEKCFVKRRDDEYYARGRETEGGGPENKITVDYRLGALMKRFNLQSESIHSWRW